MTDYYATKKRAEDKKNYSDLRKSARVGKSMTDEQARKYGNSNPNGWQNFDAQINKLMAYSDEKRRVYKKP